jgi:predicted nucleotide-binding protein
MEDKMDIKEEIEMRRKFLHRLYELRREKPNEYPSGYKIGEELGFSKKFSTTIMESLREANKIRILSSDYSADVTQPGREEVEENLFKSNEKDKKRTNENKKADSKKIFVVHGRNEKARKAMFEFLRSLGLEPIEWTQAIKFTGKTAPFIGEVLDKAFEYAQAIIVLITGDDIAKLKDIYLKEDDPDYEKKLTPQARANVLFEAGLAFGRCSDRTVLVVLEKETIRPFSDISGRHIVKLSNATNSRIALVSRLETAGCEVDLEGKSDWTNAGDFEGVLDIIDIRINNGY